MKKLLFVTLALVIGAGGVALAAVHTVGGTPTSGNTIPWWVGRPAMRFQTLWFQSEINEAGDVTKIEWQNYATITGKGGTFSNTDILLCHTSLAAVTSNFNNNYDGKTPVNVFTGTYVLPTSAFNEWVTIVSPTNFTYNNTDNLLIEVSWDASASGGTNYFKYRGSGGTYPGRVFNYTSKTATTGTVTANYHQTGRITITPTAVAPTSLGRVKALYH